ncbi:MAG: helix-turn-helix domain-containing protein [Lachnospiraceae bacterium]|nr:helix-turn-helix domain-containing protein [Lachnospiraceae bacterium]
MKKEVDFLKLYEELYQVLPTRNFQELMNVCYQTLGIPILIVDIMYNVLGIAPESPTGDPLWDYLLEHRGYDSEQVAVMIHDGIIQSVDDYEAPYVVDWGSQKDYPKLQGIVRINNIAEAYVTLNCASVEITPDLMKAMDIIQSICAFFLSGNESSGNAFHTFQKVFITELFSGRIRNKKQLTGYFNDMNERYDPPYIVTAAIIPHKKAHQLLSVIHKSSQTLCSRQLMLIQDNVLYILYYQENPFEESKGFTSALSELISRFGARVGVSNTFTNLLDITVYEQQAETAAVIAEQLHVPDLICFYRDYYLPALLLPQVRRIPKESYIPSILTDIQKYDAENMTEFFPTLKCYLRNMKSTAATAKELHIHRNTLLYRINQMEELFHISFHDYETLLHLMNCFYMLDLEAACYPDEGE